jgi:hypothetical protein
MEQQSSPSLAFATAATQWWFRLRPPWRGFMQVGRTLDGQDLFLKLSCFGN